MRPSLALLAFAASISSSAVQSVAAHAAPPNPDQLFALQQAAASKASVVAAAEATGSPSTSREREPAVRRHLRQNGRMAGHGMQRVRRGHAQHHGDHRRKRDGSSSALDSSSAEQDKDQEKSDLEARADAQYPLADSGSEWSNTTASAVSSSGDSSAKQQQQQQQEVSNSLGGYWTGVSSYYLYALADNERYQVLDAIKGGGFKVVRIFVAYVGAGNKGSNNAQVNDLEPGAVGTYDDTVLFKIDQLMVDCKARGLKLMIALSDRYALGYWSTDAYALQLNIVKPGSTGVQRVADASAFYTNSWAAGAFDKRMQHALSHKNEQLGKTWAELDEVVYAFEPQNEPQGHMAQASGTWACDRASYLKSLIKSNILVGSGGGITIDASLGAWATTCASFDIVSVHDYGTSASTAVNALKGAMDGAAKGKIVMMGEWGMTGANKASTIKSFVDAFKAAGLPWMYWEVVKPGKATSDFEVWTDEPSWGALTGGSFDSSPQYVPGASSKPPASPSAPATQQQQQKTTQWSSSKASWTPPKSSAAPAAAQQSSSGSGNSNNGNDNNDNNNKPSPSPSAQQQQQAKSSWTPPAAADQASSPAAAASPAQSSRAARKEQ